PIHLTEHHLARIDHIHTTTNPLHNHPLPNTAHATPETGQQIQARWEHRRQEWSDVLAHDAAGRPAPDVARQRSGFPASREEAWGAYQLALARQAHTERQLDRAQDPDTPSTSRALDEARTVHERAKRARTIAVADFRAWGNNPDRLTELHQERTTGLPGGWADYGWNIEDGRYRVDGETGDTWRYRASEDSWELVTPDEDLIPPRTPGRSPSPDTQPDRPDIPYPTPPPSPVPDPTPPPSPPWEEPAAPLRTTAPDPGRVVAFEGTDLRVRGGGVLTPPTPPREGESRAMRGGGRLPGGRTRTPDPAQLTEHPFADAPTTSQQAIQQALNPAPATADPTSSLPPNLTPRHLDKLPESDAAHRLISNASGLTRHRPLVGADPETSRAREGQLESILDVAVTLNNHGSEAARGHARDLGIDRTSGLGAGYRYWDDRYRAWCQVLEDGQIWVEHFDRLHPTGEYVNQETGVGPDVSPRLSPEELEARRYDEYMARWLRDAAIATVPSPPRTPTPAGRPWYYPYDSAADAPSGYFYSSSPLPEPPVDGYGNLTPPQSDSDVD
ncbi:hypothetical protein ACFXA6_54150, partial [Streptomyces mirabilis]